MPEPECFDHSQSSLGARIGGQGKDVPYAMKAVMAALPNNELNAASGPNCTRPTMSATTTVTTVPNTGS